jgi:5-guanidino-2-oxopentanoate decarboxylase
MSDAYKLFGTGRPRPVVLEFPLDFLSAPVELTAIKAHAAGRPVASAADLERSASLIDSAERPILLLGGGTADCAAEARAFVEKIGCLVVTTTAGKGVIPDSHPGSLGATLVKPSTQTLLSEADVVIAVGTELSETDNWVNRLELPGKLIRIDLDQHTLTRDYPPSVGFLADAGPTLSARLRGVPINCDAGDTQGDRASPRQRGGKPWRLPRRINFQMPVAATIDLGLCILSRKSNSSDRRTTVEGANRRR